MILEVQIWEFLQQCSEDILKISVKGPFLSCCLQKGAAAIPLPPNIFRCNYVLPR